MTNSTPPMSPTHANTPLRTNISHKQCARRFSSQGLNYISVTICDNLPTNLQRSQPTNSFLLPKKPYQPSKIFQAPHWYRIRTVHGEGLCERWRSAGDNNAIAKPVARLIKKNCFQESNLRKRLELQSTIQGQNEASSRSIQAACSRKLMRILVQ